ncbi:MAG: PQQ-binding-like beta-propeller repeat protein, partial [Candidatus Latescibacteria bacterium]|nr:PQQ-binding-like beta-propeller repeat protein [Candidatus Latescibacterota bacterium]
ALDADSADPLWAYACETYHGRTGSVATVFPADLDGDGKHEVVAGSDNWHYHAFSEDGELLWRTNTTHASTTGCSGDHDGDGSDEVLAGCEYYGPSILDSSGKRIGKIYGGPVITATALLDLDGDGKAEALVGMEDGFVRCRLADSEDAWKTNVGGAPTALAPMDVDGDGRLEVVCASESFSVYAIRADGSLVWRAELSDSVNDLALVGDAIVAGCDDGRIYLLDRTGAIAGSTDVPDPVSHVVALNEDLAVVSAGATLTALAPNP